MPAERRARKRPRLAYRQKADPKLRVLANGSGMVRVERSATLRVREDKEGCLQC